MNRALIPSGTENQTAIIAVSGLAVTLATISIILRFYTRIFTKAGLRWDDWLLLAAFVLGLLEAALLVWRKNYLRLLEASKKLCFPKRANLWIVTRQYNRPK